MVGRFIAAQCGHSFEAGLRLGLTGRLMDVGDPDDGVEDDVVNACQTCGGCCEDCTEEADCQMCVDNRPEGGDGL